MGSQRSGPRGATLPGVAEIWALFAAVPSGQILGDMPRAWPIPRCYHFGMGKQIAVRLPDDLVEFIDQQIAHGRATSRAVVVARAVARDRSREIAARDVAILSRARRDPDLDALAEYATRTPFDDLA